MPRLPSRFASLAGSHVGPLAVHGHYEPTLAKLAHRASYGQVGHAVLFSHSPFAGHRAVAFQLACRDLVRDQVGKLEVDRLGAVRVDAHGAKRKTLLSCVNW